MSARDRVRMSGEEISAYLEEQRVIQVASIGPNGRPHLAPLWYVVHASSTGERPAVATWTYAKSQKALNFRRLPQATVLLESGQRYSTLRGLSMECDVEILEDYSDVLAIGVGLIDRYGVDYEAERKVMVNAFSEQARKRIGLVLRATKSATWDFSKMG